MRITLVSPFDPRPPPGSDGAVRVGGVERVFDEVAQRLGRRGHDVTLLCSSQDAAERPTETDGAGLTVLRAPRLGTFLKAPMANLARHLPEGSDVVHVAATYPFTTPGVLRRAEALGVPSVLDFHFEPSPSSALGRLAARLYRHQGPRAYPLASVAVVRSVAYGRSAPSLQGVPRGRWRVVPNGIDPARFNADGPSREGDYLLFVGRLVPYKGLHVLLHALARHRIGIPLLIAGDGPLRASLESEARRLGLDVRFLGRVPDGDLPALYRGARLTVLPSINGQEAFGISLIESMACGTPVVASRLPGVADVAALGGRLAKPGDSYSLGRQLQEGAQAWSLPRGRRLASLVHAKYSWEAVVDRFESIYREVVAGTGRGDERVRGPGARCDVRTASAPLPLPLAA